jgi:hypothetical protein
VLSAGWDAAIFALGVSRIAAAAIDEHTTSRVPQIILSLVVPVVILVCMFKFSKSYPERVTQASGDSPHHEMPARWPRPAELSFSPERCSADPVRRRLAPPRFSWCGPARGQ